MSHQRQQGWESSRATGHAQETHTIARAERGRGGTAVRTCGCAPQPKVQVTCAITAPWANLSVRLREQVMTPAVSGYTSASTLSTATSAMRVDGNTASPDSTDQVTLTPVAPSASDISQKTTSVMSPRRGALPSRFVPTWEAAHAPE